MSADVTATFAAKDESFATTVNRLQETLNGFGQNVQSFNAEFASVAEGFKTAATKAGALVLGFIGVSSAFDGLKQSFNKAAEFQEMQRRFETLLGSTEAAQDRMDELSKFMDRTPFELPGIVRANVALQNLTNGALATERGMTQVGNAAAALGVPFDEMAQLVGRVHSALDSGAPIGRYTNRLLELGVITPEARRELEEMKNEVDSGKRGWDLIERELSKFTGSMQRQSTTWNSTMSGFADAVDNAMRAFAAPLLPPLTAAVQQLAELVRNDLAPSIERAMNAFSTDWLPGMLNALQRAYDFFAGLWQNPASIFGLFSSYLDAQMRLAGDALASAFLTAVNALSNFLSELIERGAFNRLGDVLANAFVFGVTKFNTELMNALEGAAKFWGGLWDLVTGQGSKDFAGKLYDVVQFFATDFGRAMIDPIGFIGNKITSALMDATAEASTDYEYAFNEASGAWVDRHKTGLEAAHAGAGQRLQQSAQDFGNILTSSTQAAAANTKLVEVNLFGGQQAVARTNEMAAEIAEQGRQFRESMEGSEAPLQNIANTHAPEIKRLAEDIELHFRTSETLSQQIKLNLEAANSAAQQIPSAYAAGENYSARISLNLENSAGSAEAAGDWFGKSEKSANRISIHGAEFQTSAADAAGQINNAKVDAKITADTLTGPQGLTAKFNEAMGRTQQMRDVIDEFIVGGKDVSENLRRASQQDANERRYQRSADRAHNYRERGMHRVANQVERNAKDRFLLDEAKERARQNAEDARARGLQRAEDKSTFKETIEERIRVEREYRNAIEHINKTTKEQWQKMLYDLDEGSRNAKQSLGVGGQEVKTALQEAADAVRDALSGDRNENALALEATLQQCRDFLDSINEKLPQHALT